MTQHHVDVNKLINSSNYNFYIHWWIREAIHIKKEQDKSMNRDERSYQLPHIYDYLLSATAIPSWWTVVPTKAAAVAETSTSTMYIKGCNLMNLSTY